MTDEQEARREQLARVAVEDYDHADPKRAQASTDAENELAEAYGHEEPCDYTMKATVAERVEHYRTREPECDGFEDSLDRAERLADQVPFATAKSWAEAALDDRYEDGYGPGVDDSGGDADVAYLAASMVVQRALPLEVLQTALEAIETEMSVEDDDEDQTDADMEYAMRLRAAADALLAVPGIVSTLR